LKIVSFLIVGNKKGLIESIQLSHFEHFA